MQIDRILYFFEDDRITQLIKNTHPLLRIEPSNVCIRFFCELDSFHWEIIVDGEVVDNGYLKQLVIPSVSHARKIVAKYLKEK